MAAPTSRDFYYDQYEQPRYASEDYMKSMALKQRDEPRQMQAVKALEGLHNRFFSAQQSAAQPIPKPTPEPNPVLLLLGDEE